MKRLLPAILLGLLLACAVSPVLAQDSGRQSTPAAHSEQASEGEKDSNDLYRHSAMVKKMGEMMGMQVDTAATLFEVLNFAVLALAVGWFLAKALPKTFRERTSAIQKELVDARTATEDAKLRLSSVEDRLAHLDGQIAGMKAQAEKDGAAEEARLRTTIEEEKQRILASADQEIATATITARRDLQRYAAELAIEQAARKLVVSAETDRLLVQGFARRLTGDDTTGGQN